MTILRLHYVVAVLSVGCAPSAPSREVGIDALSWSCANSSYHGQQYWTCSNGSLNKCDAAGNPERMSCPALGCHANPAGIDDQCVLPSPGWSCADSRGSDGKQYWTCSGDGNVHECQGTTPVELACAGGCNHNPVNSDDTCKTAAVPTNVRAAAGNRWAVVRWSGTARSAYTITSSPGSIVRTTDASTTSIEVDGLANGIRYSFSVSQDGGPAAQTNAVLPGSDANIISDVRHHPQTRALTCEEASLVTVLSHEGIVKTEDDVLVDIGIDWTPASWDASGRLHWGDPYRHFVGDPDGSEPALTGYGTYAPPIARAAADFGAVVLQSGQLITPQTVYRELLAGHPVVAWVTTDFSDQPRQADWITDDGTTIGWYGPHEHAVALVGVERDTVIIDNPLDATEWQRVPKTTFESTYATFAQMAVVVQ